MDEYKLVVEIAKEINQAGGEVFLVGGFVRDLLRDKTSKDYDLEVYGLNADDLEVLLNQFGPVLKKGKSFGVFSLVHTNLDIALPRNEKKCGLRHQDFIIESNPYLDKKEASSRRDFTINAFMQNVLTGEIYDFHGGREDLKNGLIRHIDATSFIEDPLRVLRAARFSSQLNFKVAKETIELCKTIDCRSLSKERILEETNRALLSDHPSLYFETLREMDKLHELYPELYQLIGIVQNPCHHLEDAYTHTMMALENAKEYKSKSNKPLYFMYAALVHDLGKIDAKKHGDHYGWRHEFLGVEKIDTFLKRYTNEKELIFYCKEICKNHMRPHGLFRNKAQKEEILALLDATPYYKDLLYFGICDDLSRITKEGVDSSAYIQWVEDALLEYENFLKRDLINGLDLIAIGYKEGIHLKEALYQARQLEYLYSKETVLTMMKGMLCENSNKSN